MLSVQPVSFAVQSKKLSGNNINFSANEAPSLKEVQSENKKLKRYNKILLFTLGLGALALTAITVKNHNLSKKIKPLQNFRRSIAEQLKNIKNVNLSDKTKNDVVDSVLDVADDIITSVLT